MGFVNLDILRQNFIDFIGNPDKSWGEPTEINVQNGYRESRIPTQANRNTARLGSRTYTPEQRVEYERQLAQLEQQGGVTVVFPGDPSSLPASVTERTCMSCGKTFRSVKIGEGGSCYNCELDRLCPPFVRFTRRYYHRDGWSMEAFDEGWSAGAIAQGRRNRLAFLWGRRIPATRADYQGLVVYCNQEGTPLELTFSTMVSPGNCYEITFDLTTDTVWHASRDQQTVDLNVHPRGRALEASDERNLYVALAMLPPWMYADTLSLG